MNTRETLAAFKAGEIDLETAASQLQGFQDLGHSRVDIQRGERTGTPEVIYGQGKTTQQILDIIQSLNPHQQNILVTRITPETAETLQAQHPTAHYHPTSKLFTLTQHPLPTLQGKIAVICAGTSDLPIAEEAAQVAEFYGNPVERIYDAGVAGLHRLLASLDTIHQCRVVICVAGMEGALPSVVGGLVKAPIIAVPTSVGYGANFGGISALLTMLNSCASGISVVNIDNGFGAGFLANRINRLGE